jgi:hypothetical protein
MRKNLLLISAIALIPLAGLALPATAQSPAVSGVSQPAAEQIDLGAIPAKPVTGHLAIRGIAADDESDDLPRVRNMRGKHLAALSGENEDGLGSDGEAD